MVVGAGELDERHRLIGAYQGIALGMATRTASRFDTGAIRSLVWRYEQGAVVLSTLRDGYYLVLSLGPGCLVRARRPPLRGRPREAGPGDLTWACWTACAAASAARARSSTRRSRTSSAAAARSTQDALEAVEEALLAADMGLPAVAEAMEVLRARSPARSRPGACAAMREALREELRTRARAAGRGRVRSRRGRGSCSWSA